MNPSWPNPFAHNDLQANPAIPERPGPVKAARTRSITMNAKPRGRPRIDYPAMQSPSIKDIVFAAAFYEGEGHFNGSVIINQNNREKLDWLCNRFGGRIYGPYTGKPAYNDFYSLVITRERALGFMFTIFTFLSASRRAQFKSVLNGEPNKREYQNTHIERSLDKHFNKTSKAQKGPLGLFGVKR